MQQPVAWRHETTCEFISDEMKREFPDTLFIRKCNIPLFGEPIIGTTEAVRSDIILREQIDAQNVALQEAREEYAMLKAQFDELNKLYTDAVTSSVPDAGGNVPNVKVIGESDSTAGLGVTATLTGDFVTAFIAPARTESLTPSAYRLAKKPDGVIVLQGAFLWQEGFSLNGHEWRDIPTVDLDTPNVELTSRPTPTERTK